MPEVGILDTSVLIELARIDQEFLPDQAAITSVTLAELAAGPHRAVNPLERSSRQERNPTDFAGLEPTIVLRAA